MPRGRPFNGLVHTQGDLRSGINGRTHGQTQTKRSWIGRRAQLGLPLVTMLHTDFTKLLPISLLIHIFFNL